MGVRECILRRAGRRMWRRRPGQVMPLAALGLFIMVMSIVATMNLGQAVYQKIRVQNAADAAAYSLAAMEARAFNFVALTNRTQIVHYNTALALQSYLSYAGFVVSLTGTMRDLANAIRSVVQTGCSTLPYPANVPFCAAVGPATAMANVAGIFAKIASQIYDLLHRFIPMGVEALSLFNRYAIWEMQLIRLVLVNAHLLTGVYEFVTANDDQLGWGSKGLLLNWAINSLLNYMEFRTAFDAGAGVNPGLVDLIVGLMNKPTRLTDYSKDPPQEMEEAQAVMAELINASRSHKDIYNRSGMVAVTMGWDMIAGMKMGQAKIVDSGKLGPEVRTIRHSQNDGHYPVGDTLASDDYLAAGAMGIFFAPPAPAFVMLLPGPTGSQKLGDGVYADKDGGGHYRYRSPGGQTPGAPNGWSSIAFAPFPPRGLRRTMAKRNESDHKFQPSPYFKFNALGDRYKDYNQPSTWVFLNKHHENFQTGDNKRPWHYQFTFKQGSQPAVSLDTTIGGSRTALLFEGINVISRGMAYYHRPGVWDEHPNFFNPFWRARLAPVGSKLMNLWDKYVSSNITSSSENQVVRGLVNFLRNLLADVFFRVVTSVITH